MFSLALTGPACPDDTVREACPHFLGVRTVAAVYLDTSRNGDESENFIAVNRIAAFGQVEINAFQVLVNDQHIILEIVFDIGSLLDVEPFRTAVADFFPLFGFLPLHFHVTVDEGVDVQTFVGDAPVEIGYGLIAQLLDEAHQDGFIVFYLAVLEFPFQRFAGKLCLLGGHFFQGLTNFGTGFRGGHEVQPVLFRSLGRRGHDFHLVATDQWLTYLGVFTVHFRTDAVAADVGVDGKGEVQHGGTLRQLVQVSFRSEDKHYPA